MRRTIPPSSYVFLFLHGIWWLSYLTETSGFSSAVRTHVTQSSTLVLSSRNHNINTIVGRESTQQQEYAKLRNKNGGEDATHATRRNRNNSQSSTSASHHRRAILEGVVASTASTAALVFPSTKANALGVVPPPQAPTYSMAPTSNNGRIEGIGGGFDIRAPSPAALKSFDVVYPPSMIGTWQCQRVVTLVEGDKGQAMVAWKLLGGNSDDESYMTKQKIETFQTNYVESPPLAAGTVVLDRGYEMASRTQTSSSTNPPLWDVQTPNKLRYYPTTTNSDKNFVQIEVVQRTVEIPTDQGFGFNELYKISTPLSGFFGSQGSSDQILERAVRVARRYRRAFDDKGNRVVEGLEIMKTYRVMDGVAGIEMPTSTTKSQIRMTRPPPSS